MGWSRKISLDEIVQQINSVALNPHVGLSTGPESSEFRQMKRGTLIVTKDVFSACISRFVEITPLVSLG